jgi:hypothetical protein
MRNIILGAIAGLVLGSAVALAYSDYVADVKLADLQAQLDAANEKLAKAAKDHKPAPPELTAATEQIDELQATNDDLKKQLAAAKSAPAVTQAPPAFNPMMLMGMMRGMRGGLGGGPGRMLLLQTRLHLTADQTAKLRAAMAADDKARRAAFEQRRQNGGGPPNPQDFAKFNTFDQTLDSILTPDQKTAYQQVQADEQSSRAETAATIQVNTMAPLLQLTDAQKDQISSALYETQMSSPDPMTLMGNPNAATIMAQQAKAAQDALTKVLTPDQQTVYQQAAQVLNDFGGGPGGGRQRGNGGGGNGGNNAPAPATAAATPAPAAAAPATDGSTPAATTTPAATDASSTATNAPTATDSSTTNAAPAAAQ